MGQLVYGSTEYEIDDRMLAHLESVVVAKYRRREGFMVSWTTPAPDDARIELWLSPGNPLQLRYAGSRSPLLSQSWVQAMMGMAGTLRGLRLVGEAQAVREATMPPAWQH
ncbi:DUF7882 family protein [Agrococcus jejuensis]|uniref:DUF7882 domain-containing protein n=1 Tax=Agrococcus jejuensis TaxID=399736 RepID=A0A1G8F0M1_9MICO|nr:hypothetical protein [Agrococcus jejuensis]SDH75670.1 hypothetical protein SAMN04489720_2273 [Agrococcus jejuensis]